MNECKNVCMGRDEPQAPRLLVECTIVCVCVCVCGFNWTAYVTSIEQMKDNQNFLILYNIAYMIGRDIGI